MKAILAGVDEAGRGPLAGPVVAAAVILDRSRSIPGLADSKKLSPGARQRLDAEIRSHAIAWAIGVAEVPEIDRLNILQATFLAMQRAVSALQVLPSEVRVDGNRAPRFGKAEVITIIGGDGTEPSISAASILAKVHRDRLMIALDQEYPDYGFAGHKGYGTRAHLQALSRLGPSPAHRRSFSPVRQMRLL